ncbi:MAG: hypothetical protein CMM02_05600 [Rhodopirellula sp.]|nr:hypothetical protein [Rhodopirellula sp.]
MNKIKKNKISYLLKNNNLRNFYYEIISHTSGIDNIVLGSKTNINSAGSIFNRDNTKYFGIERYLQYLDIHSYLPDDILTKVDRAAMSVSLETRVPFLDYKLVEYAFQLPRNKLIKNKNGKLILKKELDKYVPRRLTERPKMGFGIPLQEWLAGPLNDWANDLLSEKVIKEQGYLDYELVNKIWNRCKKDNSHSLIWNILMFQNWLTSK